MCGAIFLYGTVKTKCLLRCYYFTKERLGATFQWSSPMRSFIALLTAAFIGLAFTPTAASARPFGGGFHGGGFHGGFHGGFRGGGFRRGFGGFGPLVGVGVGLGLAAGYPYWGGPGYYGYGDGCLAPRRIWTPYGWRTRWVNVCY
jgi:hypothetical protein